MQAASTSLPKRRTASFLAGLMLLVSMLPAFALASSVSLPAANFIYHLGAAPINHSAELFDTYPSHNIEVLEEQRFSNTYSINLVTQTAYSFVVGGFEFDLLFLITDINGNVILDSRDAHNAEDGLELRFVAPSTASYHLVTSSMAGNEVGEYEIRINAIPDFAGIEGRVENTLGQGLEEILVSAYLPAEIAGEREYLSVLSTVSDQYGNYELYPLEEGSYKLSFRDLNLRHGNIYYNQADMLEMADSVLLAPNENATLTTQILEEASVITGTVSDSGGAALEGISVSASIERFGDFISFASTETDASGDYALMGLEAGDYIISFSCPQGLFLTQYYAGATSPDQAEILSLSAQDLREEVDARLGAASSITGRVLGNNNVPADDISVSLLRLRADNSEDPHSLDCFELISQDLTEDDGSYFFGGLLSGSYFLHFADTQDRFLDVYYFDSFVPSRAGPIELDANDHLTLRDVGLTLDSSISGTVADTSLNSLPSISVRLFDLHNAPSPLTQDFFNYPSFETFTDDFGDFRLGDITPGNYILEFQDLAGGHSTIYHFQQDNPNNANIITITPGTHLSQHNATLSPASHITGTLVCESTGLLMPNVRVSLLDADTRSVFAQTLSDENADFSLSPLEAGNYYLSYLAPGYNYPEDLQFFEGSFDLEGALQITLDTHEHLDLGEVFWRTLPTVTLTLDAQNASTPQISEHTTGTSVDAPPAPSRAGHIFGGWHLIDGSAVTFPLVLEEDLTLIAHWTRADIILSFDVGGGSQVADLYFSYRDQAGELPIPARQGYSFRGWLSPDTGALITPSTVLRESKTLTARWSEGAADITFNSHGGSFISHIPLIAGQTIGALPTPHRSYHVFLGWYTQESGGRRIDASFAPTTSTTLHARWRALPVTVHFDAGAGSLVRSQTRGLGTSLGVLPTPSKPNHSFRGWSLDSAGRQRANPTMRMQRSITLFAQWEGSAQIQLPATHNLSFGVHISRLRAPSTDAVIDTSWRSPLFMRIGER